MKISSHASWSQYNVSSKFQVCGQIILQPRKTVSFLSICQSRFRLSFSGSLYATHINYKYTQPNIHSPSCYLSGVHPGTWHVFVIQTNSKERTCHHLNPFFSQGSVCREHQWRQWLSCCAHSYRKYSDFTYVFQLSSLQSTFSYFCCRRGVVIVNRQEVAGTLVLACHQHYPTGKVFTHHPTPQLY